MALFLDVEIGDVVSIGNATRVSIERKSGHRTRLRIDSDYKVQLDRADNDPPKPAKAEPTIKRPVLSRTA